MESLISNILGFFIFLAIISLIYGIIIGFSGKSIFYLNWGDVGLSLGKAVLWLVVFLAGALWLNSHYNSETLAFVYALLTVALFWWIEYRKVVKVNSLIGGISKFRALSIAIARFVLSAVIILKIFDVHDDLKEGHYGEAEATFLIATLLFPLFKKLINGERILREKGLWEKWLEISQAVPSEEGNG